MKYTKVSNTFNTLIHSCWSFCSKHSLWLAYVLADDDNVHCVKHKVVCSCQVDCLHPFTVKALLQDEVAAGNACNLELHAMVQDLKVTSMMMLQFCPSLSVLNTFMLKLCMCFVIMYIHVCSPSCCLQLISYYKWDLHLWHTSFKLSG